MDPYISYRYLNDGREVEAQCSSAHPRIAAGVARPVAGESAEAYTAWLEAQGEDAGSVSAWEDEGGAQEGDEEADEGTDSEDEPTETEADAEATAAIDLRETPVRHLRAALAEVTDLSVLEALANSDDRRTAARHYAARIAELQAADQEADEPEPEAGDG